jgi:hypothetical protein
MFQKCVLFGLGFAVSAAFAQPSGRLDLGILSNGATVSFVREAGGEWGIEISGGQAPPFAQPKPAQIEVFRGGETAVLLAAGYRSVRKEADTVVAEAEVTGAGRAVFSVEDSWSVSGAVLSLGRKTTVTAAEDGAGFSSAIRFSSAPSVGWDEVHCLIPGLHYFAPHTRDGAPGGRLHDQAKCFSVGEDRGEIEAAMADALPRFVESRDLRGDLHVHTDWSDGAANIETMANKAEFLDCAYVTVRDHSRSAF